MIEEIFSGYGIKILKDGARYFIEYDAGEIAVQLRQVEVTAEEAEKARKSEHDAYEVLISK